MHKNVINDNGVPMLKKRGVYVPGHDEVLEPDEREALYSKERAAQPQASKSEKFTKSKTSASVAPSNTVKPQQIQVDD